MEWHLDASIQAYLADPTRPLEGLSRDAYRAELADFGAFLVPYAPSLAFVAQAFVGSLSRRGLTAPEIDDRLKRLRAFLAWSSAGDDADLAPVASQLLPALDSAVETLRTEGPPVVWPGPLVIPGPAAATDATEPEPSPAAEPQYDSAPGAAAGAGGGTAGGGGGADVGTGAVIGGGGGGAFGGASGGAFGGQGDFLRRDGPVFDEAVAAPGLKLGRSETAPPRPAPRSFGPPPSQSHPSRAAPPPPAPPAPLAPDEAPMRASLDVGAAPEAEAGPPDDQPAGAELGGGDEAPPAPPHEAFGKLVAPDIATVGEPFELEVGLSAERPEGTAGGKISLPPLEVAPYDIEVQLVADSFDMGPGESFRQKLEVSKATPYPTVTVHLTARPQNDPKTVRTVQATFGIRGETVGVAIRTVDVYVPGAAPRAALKVPSISGMSAGVPMGESRPDVTIEIFTVDSSGIVDEPGALRWNVRSPHDGVATAGDSAIRRGIAGSPREFAAQTRTVVEQNDGSEAIGQILIGAGRNIGRAVPPEVWAALRRARSAVPDRPLDILILSQEPYVPWELAVPAQPLTAGGAATFLGAEANIGRWLLGEPPPAADPPRSVVAASMGVVKGHYVGSSFGTLKGADEEVKTLHDLYAAETVDPKAMPIRQLLAGQPGYGVIHFAVHGAVDEGGGDDGLILAADADGVSLALSPVQVDGATLPAGSPFVFLNACQVGAARQSLASYGGLSAAFVRWGAAGVVAPIWAIDDDVSHEIALGIYERALAHDPPPVASLLREARLRFDPSAATTSATFMAYQLYGHPSMRLVR